MMSETVSIVIEIPKGDYCAKFSTDITDIGIHDMCNLLKMCGDRSYYCPIANSDTHCGKDGFGILKQRDYYDNVCPSLYGERIMELLREISQLRKGARGVASKRE